MLFLCFSSISFFFYMFPYLSALLFSMGALSASVLLTFFDFYRCFLRNWLFFCFNFHFPLLRCFCFGCNLTRSPTVQIRTVSISVCYFPEKTFSSSYRNLHFSKCTKIRKRWTCIIRSKRSFVCNFFFRFRIINFIISESF